MQVNTTRWGIALAWLWLQTTMLQRPLTLKRTKMLLILHLCNKSSNRQKPKFQCRQVARWSLWVKIQTKRLVISSCYCIMKTRSQTESLLLNQMHKTKTTMVLLPLRRNKSQKTWWTLPNSRCSQDPLKTPNLRASLSSSKSEAKRLRTYRHTSLTSRRKSPNSIVLSKTRTPMSRKGKNIAIRRQVTTLDCETEISRRR